MLTLFYVAPRRKPQLSILVVDQQDAPAIHNNEVRDQMLRWCRRLRRSEKGRTGINPIQRFAAMSELQRIDWADRLQLAAN
jgi:hypothetical protein